MSSDDLGSGSAEAPTLEPPKRAVIEFNGVRKVFWYRNGEEVPMPPLDLGPDLDDKD